MKWIEQHSWEAYEYSHHSYYVDTPENRRDILTCCIFYANKAEQNKERYDASKPIPTIDEALSLLEVSGEVDIEACYGQHTTIKFFTPIEVYPYTIDEEGNGVLKNA